MSGIDLLGFEVFWPNSFCQALPRVVCPREGSRRGGGPWPSSGASTPSLRRANADAPPSYVCWTKVHHPKWPSWEPGVGLEIDLRGARARSTPWATFVRSYVVPMICCCSRGRRGAARRFGADRVLMAAAPSHCP